MHPFHILVSVLNLITAATMLLAFAPAVDASLRASLLAPSVLVGYFASVLAVLVGLVVVVWVAFSKVHNRGNVWSRHRLSVFNAVFVVLCWSVFFAVGRLTPSANGEGKEASASYWRPGPVEVRPESVGKHTSAPTGHDF